MRRIPVVPYSAAEGCSGMPISNVVKYCWRRSISMPHPSVKAWRSSGHRPGIDCSGACRLDCRGYSYVGPFCDGRAVVCREELFGFIDSEGKPVVPLRYAFASNFREGLAVVRIDGKFGYIDTEGTVVIDAAFDHAGCFRDGRARVECEGEIFSIDRTGKKVR